MCEQTQIKISCKHITRFANPNICIYRTRRKIIRYCIHLIIFDKLPCRLINVCKSCIFWRKYRCSERKCGCIYGITKIITDVKLRTSGLYTNTIRLKFNSHIGFQCMNQFLKQHTIYKCSCRLTLSYTLNRNLRTNHRRLYIDFKSVSICRKLNKCTSLIEVRYIRIYDTKIQCLCQRSCVCCKLHNLLLLLNIVIIKNIMFYFFNKLLIRCCMHFLLAKFNCL